MIILDTNVVSELMRLTPSPAVMAWYARQDFSDLYMTAVTEAELRRGLSLLPPGRRQERMLAEAETLFAKDFAGRILPFDSPAAKAFATIFAQRQAAGRPISHPDCEIAAIAQATPAAIATRNVRDFEGCGIEVIDPWSLRLAPGS